MIKTLFRCLGLRFVWPCSLVWSFYNHSYHILPCCLALQPAVCCWPGPPLPFHCQLCWWVSFSIKSRSFCTGQNLSICWQYLQLKLRTEWVCRIMLDLTMRIPKAPYSEHNFSISSFIFVYHKLNFWTSRLCAVCAFLPWYFNLAF